MEFSLLTIHAPGFWLLLSLFASLALLLLHRHITREQRLYLAIGLWLGIPYSGLLLGGLSPRLLGLGAIDWLVSLSLGLGLLFVTLLLLLFVRATLSITNQEQRATSVDRASLYTIMLQSAEEFHWCFLRGALWELLQMTPTPPALPAYWAVWLAALLAAPEALFWVHTTTQRLLTVIVLVSTTVLFFYTRNFWLCWLLHTAAWLIGAPTSWLAADATEHAKS